MFYKKYIYTLKLIVVHVFLTVANSAHLTPLLWGGKKRDESAKRKKHKPFALNQTGTHVSHSSIREVLRSREDRALNSSEIASTKPICLVLFISSIFGYVIQNVFFQESAEIETEKPPWKIPGVLLLSMLAFSLAICFEWVVHTVMLLNPILTLLFSNSLAPENIWDCWRKRKTTSSEQSKFTSIIYLVKSKWLYKTPKPSLGEDCRS